MTADTIRRTLVGLGALLSAGAVFGLVVFLLVRFWPQPSPLPAQLARQDEKTAGRAADAIGADTARQNDAAHVQIDLTTKDIRDAFDALPPPAPAPAAGEPAPALPAAPVDRLRDRLNEGVARANRAAGTAGAPS